MLRVRKVTTQQSLCTSWWGCGEQMQTSCLSYFRLQIEVSVQIYAQRADLPRKVSPVPLTERFYGPQSQSVTFWSTQNFLVVSWVKCCTSIFILFILIPCHVHLLLFCTMTNKCTIISQIITLLHVSTLSGHPQGAGNQFLV